MSVELRWFPQSFVQLRTEELTMHIDPSMASTFLDIVRLSFPPHGANAKLPPGIGPGGLVLVTHPHPDHLAPGTASLLTGKDGIVLAPESCRRKLRGHMSAVAPGDRRTVRGAEIRVVETYNPEGTRRMTYHPRGTGVGYLVNIGGVTAYHAGDTGLIEDMRTLGEVDVALLPIGGRFTMDIAEAAEAAEIIAPRTVVPMHRLRADAQRFRQEVERRCGSEVRVLGPGEPLGL